jgi:hypothetical protein
MDPTEKLYDMLTSVSDEKSLPTFDEAFNSARERSAFIKRWECQRDLLFF